MLFIFDWDGTVCDSTQKIARCMIEAASALKLPPITEADVFNIIGLGLPEAITTLFPAISERDMGKLKAGYSERFVLDDHQPSKLFEGVEETLAVLKQEGIHIAVATGKSRRGLNRVLKALDWSDYFHSSRCADETASKPDPLMVHELIEELNKAPEECVLIGDTEYDMEMAKRAGIDRIAVSFGAHHIDRLLPYEPKLCVDRFGDILDYLSYRK